MFYCLRFEPPQPGGPGPRIYIPLEQGGPGTGFPFHRLLQPCLLLITYRHGPHIKLSSSIVVVQLLFY
jgi:hypothetical protein